MITLDSEIIRRVQHLSDIVEKHEKWRNNDCLNLISSENIMSLKARSLLSSDLVHRYTARDNFYGGTKFINEIESFVSETASKVFNSKHADVRSLSGHVCNLAVLTLLPMANNSVIAVSPENGGYPGMARDALGSMLNLNIDYFPYSDELMNLKVDECKHVLSDINPNLILFGSSFIPFPHPVTQLNSSSKDSISVFDGSHVLGLIAGKEFQDPLSEGCDILIGSTHKSFFGPQGGIILSNNSELFNIIDQSMFPTIIDNAHWNRIASLGYALLEMEQFGKEYASQIIRNSKALSSHLNELGVPVKGKQLGFTDSHQIVLEYDSDYSAELSAKLQTFNIIIDKGIRLGTSEITRRGMNESDMIRVGDIFYESIQPSVERSSIIKKVDNLLNEFNEPKFTFK